MPCEHWGSLIIDVCGCIGILSSYEPGIHKIYKQRGFPQLGKQKQCSPHHWTHDTYYQYCTQERAIPNYVETGWFPYLSNTDKDKLERLQRLCLRVMLPDIDNYDQRLSHLNLEYLSVHLDVTCLKYIDRMNNTDNHPLSKYIPEVHTTEKTHRRGLARPTCRTALCGKSLFYKYF